MAHVEKKRSNKLGVVFSSGFFGFFSHAGFLAAVRERGLRPCGYAGASSGAILAAMAASEMSDAAIRRMLFSLRKEDFWDPDSWHVIVRKALRGFRGHSGYLKGEGFASLLTGLPQRKIEDCPVPLGIVATNLTRCRETVFTRGDLIKAVQASGAVPMLFKPVEIDGSLFVDGGVVNKAPAKALADLVSLEKIIVHFIESDNVGEKANAFLRKRLTPWHIQHLAVNVSRQEAYQQQLENLSLRGIEVLEVKTRVPAVGPNHLERGLPAYDQSRKQTLKILSELEI
jgi:NTE family protein